MAISALTDPVPSADIHETLVEFPDNRLLIDLCGEFDRNLAQIEHELSVQILRRGNQLAVIGEDDTRAQAVRVLEGLYQKLEAGRSIDAGEIDGEIRMG
ncbi:MAG: phosphate starvation-inducible protein PhoH, partial [Pseudomonadota bacterium]